MSSSHDMTSTHCDSKCHALAADLLPRRSVGAHIPRAGECSTAHTYLGPGNVQRREDPRVRVRFVPRSTARIWQHADGRRSPRRLRQHSPRKRRWPQEIPCPWKPWPLTPSTTLASRATSIRCYSRVDAFTSDGAAQSRTASHSTSPGRGCAVPSVAKVRSSSRIRSPSIRRSWKRCTPRRSWRASFTSPTVSKVASSSVRTQLPSSVDTVRAVMTSSVLNPRSLRRRAAVSTRVYWLCVV